MDSQRTLTLRHDESFEAQKRQRLRRTERQRDTSRHQAPVHDVSKVLLTGYYTLSSIIISKPGRRIQKACAHDDIIVNVKYSTPT